MARGDLILYKSTGRWNERAIVFATHGPYVHVAIVVDGFSVIAADAQGIRIDALPPTDALHTPLSLAPYATTQGIEQGLAWAMAQKGKRYGWSDIVYQAVKFLAPNNKLQVVVAGHYDCSDFASRYMRQAGVVLPPDFADPYANTPNDLGRTFGLLPARKGGSCELVAPRM